MLFTATALVSVLFALLVLQAHGIFEEQVGEADWKSEQLGFITDTIIKDKNVLVAVSSNSTSDGGILASLDIKTGNVAWKTMIKKSASFKKLAIVSYSQGIAVKDALVTLSLEEELNGKGSFQWYLRGWTCEHGKLLWEMLIGIAHEGGDHHPIDLVYHPDLSLITVLADNAVHFVKTTYTSIVGSWSWYPDNTFVVSQLLVAASSPKETSSSSSRVAIGCYKAAKRDRDRCSTGGYVVADTHSEAASVVSFPVQPDAGLLHPSSQYLVHSSTDFIVGTTTAAFAVVALSSSSQKDRPVQLQPTSSELSLAFGAKYASIDASKVTTTLYPHQEGTSVSFCVEGASCAVFVARYGARGAGTDKKWLLTQQSSDPSGANCGQVVPLQESAVAGVSGPDSQALFCLKSRSTPPEANGAYSMLEALHLQSVDTPLRSTELSMKTKAPLYSSNPFHHISLLGSPNCRSSQPSCPLLVLMVLQSGLTLLVKVVIDPSGQSKNTVLWSREEAFSRVKQMVIADKVQLDSSMSYIAHMHDHALPSLQERLQMQKDEISQKWAAMVGRFSPQNLMSLVSEEQDSHVSFDKVAIVLSHSNTFNSHGTGDSLQDSSLDAGWVCPFSQAGLQVSAIDLTRAPGAKTGPMDAHRDVCSSLWIVHPTLPAGTGDPLVSFVRLLRAGHESAVNPQIVLVVGTVEGHSYLWTIDAQTGEATSARTEDARDGEQTCSSDSTSETCKFPSSAPQSELRPAMQGFNRRVQLLPPAMVLKKGVASLARVGVAVGTGSSASTVSMLAVLHSGGGDDDLPVSLIADDESLGLTRQQMESAESREFYVHRVEAASGTVRVYRLTNRSCENTELGTDTGAVLGAVACKYAELVSATTFPPSTETIVGVTYLNPADKVHSRVSILGDDSVLLKYINPSMVLVSTISPPAAAVSEYDDMLDANSNATSVLSLTLVDTVTGGVIKRITHAGAVRPVRAVMVENMIVATYWNAKARRAELSSTALYEGALDRYELSPLSSGASSRRKSRDTRNQVASPYTATPPMAMQKSYILPRPATALAHTVTAKGIANKNILVGFTNGQIFSVDMRQIHPRKPMADPTIAEKTEGLSRYSPFLSLDAAYSAITYNYTLGSGPAHIVSSASSLESTSLVVSFGGSAVDLHVTRVLPSKGFDMLPSNFNYIALVAILAGLAAAALVLQRMTQKKRLHQLWA